MEGKRYLVAKVLTDRGARGLSLVTVTRAAVFVMPFERETAATVYVPSAVAILKPTAIGGGSSVEQVVANAKGDVEVMSAAFKQLGLFQKTKQIAEVETDSAEAEVMSLLGLKDCAEDEGRGLFAAPESLLVVLTVPVRRL